jgi:hypothetical protein
MAKYWAVYFADMNEDKPARLFSEELSAASFAEAKDHAWKRTFEISEAYGYRLYATHTEPTPDHGVKDGILADDSAVAEEQIFD